jgi:hypothetical protein
MRRGNTVAALEESDRVVSASAAHEIIGKLGQCFRESVLSRADWAVLFFNIPVLVSRKVI